MKIKQSHIQAMEKKKDISSIFIKPHAPINKIKRRNKVKLQTTHKANSASPSS